MDFWASFLRKNFFITLVEEQKDIFMDFTRQMENRIDTTCVTKLQQPTPTTIGSSSRANMVDNSTKRSNSTNCPSSSTNSSTTSTTIQENSNHRSSSVSNNSPSSSSSRPYLTANSRRSSTSASTTTNNNSNNNNSHGNFKTQRPGLNKSTSINNDWTLSKSTTPNAAGSDASTSAAASTSATTNSTMTASTNTTTTTDDSEEAMTNHNNNLATTTTQQQQLHHATPILVAQLQNHHNHFHLNNYHHQGHASATVELKQTRLEQRTSTMFHRLRRLQFAQSRSHVDAELNAANTSFRRCLDHAQLVRDREAYKDVRSLVNDPLLDQKLETLIKLGELRPEYLNFEELRHATPTSMAHILKRYEKLLRRIVFSPPPLATSTNPSSSAAAASSSTSTTAGGGYSMKNLPPNMFLDKEDLQSLGRVTRSLQSHLTSLQRHYDSDATESSSGGESCDEDEKEVEIMKPSGKFRHSTLENRASWQWWTERGWLGSRWAWVQFQLADLEYKIRQHVDLYKQLRIRKTKSTSRKNSDATITRVRPSQISCDGDTIASEDPSPSEDCARTRPVDVSTTSRRIIKTKGMFRWNRKTVTRSTLHCGCAPPYSPCISCSGRSDAKELVDVSSQTRAVRNSILESAYHPVLSISYRGKGIGLDRKLQAAYGAPRPAAKCVKWMPHQNTFFTLRPPSQNTNQGRFGKGATSIDASPDKSRRKKNRQTDEPQVLGKRPYSTANRRQGMATLKRAKKFRLDRVRPDFVGVGKNGLFRSSAGSQDDNSLCPGKVGNVRRTTERHSTFDINNIIVDPRVAATTRVEKLHYKEIQTPKWRIHDFPELSLAKIVQEKDELEDITDTTVSARHDVKQAVEKRRFVPVLQRDLHQQNKRSHLLSQSWSIDSSNGGGSPIGSPVVNNFYSSPFVASPSSGLNSIVLAAAVLAKPNSTSFLAPGRPYAFQNVEHPPPSSSSSSSMASAAIMDKLAPGEPPGETVLGYEPYETRHFPLDGVEAEELCNGNHSFLEEEADEDDGIVNMDLNNTSDDDDGSSGDDSDLDEDDELDDEELGDDGDDEEEGVDEDGERMEDGDDDGDEDYDPRESPQFDS